jgi:hypothetical protein
MAALPEKLRDLEEIPTLKSIRRLVNRRTIATFSPEWEIHNAACEMAAVEILSRDMISYQRMLDRLIGELGPRWPLSLMEELAESEDGQAERELGEDRAKDTDEVAEASNSPSEDADTHGGDGNSGEVDAPAETASEDERQGDSPEDCESEGENGGEEGDGEGSAEDPKSETTGDSSEGGNAEGENGGEDGQGEDGNGGDTESDSPWPAFRLDPDASEIKNFRRFLEYIEAVVERQREVSREEALAEEPEEPLQLDITSLGAKGSHGGINCRLEDLEARGAHCDQRDVSEIVRQIEKIFRSMDDIAGSEPSPRISGKRLVTELVSRRVNLSKARREELQPGVKLLMCDVSGSCSAVCGETLAACAAVAQADPQVVIVVHSNGHPEEVYGQAAAGVDLADWYEHAHGLNYRWWLQLMERCRIIGTINWGDWDAGFVLEKLAEQAPLVWLDSYCARDGVRPASRKLRAGAARWSATPTSWWQGVNNARSTAIALRHAAREMK